MPRCRSGHIYVIGQQSMCYIERIGGRFWSGTGMSVATGHFCFVYTVASGALDRIWCVHPDNAQVFLEKIRFNSLALARQQLLTALILPGSLSALLLRSSKLQQSIPCRPSNVKASLNRRVGHCFSDANSKGLWPEYLWVMYDALMASMKPLSCQHVFDR